MSKENELLPCPFCGGKAVIDDYHAETLGFFIECGKCGGQVDDVASIELTGKFCCLCGQKKEAEEHKEEILAKFEEARKKYVRDKKKQH